jgi:uncharacterized protein with NRDE domain
MCLILLSFRQDPEYPVIFASNRDEFFARPAEPARFWGEVPDMLAGRDLQAGGTWLGITRSGRFATVSNVREPDLHDVRAPSRGQLVTDFLRGEISPEAYLARIAKVADRYNGFNLLLGDSDAIFFFSNREGSTPKGFRRLLPGLYGLSNHLLDTPWPKVETGKAALRAAMERGDFDEEHLLAILRDDSMPVLGTLPETGVGPEWERVLAPVFITSESYGTRASTAIRIHRTGKVSFVERTFPEGVTSRYEFEIESPAPNPSPE